MDSASAGAVRHFLLSFTEVLLSEVKLSCHGTVKAQFNSKGEAVGCEKNSECGKGEFCDLDIERPSSMGKEKGICCSSRNPSFFVLKHLLEPTDCGGELPSREVGIKMCSDGCDEAAGEICRMDINKPAASRWKSDQGVCCKSEILLYIYPDNEFSDLSENQFWRGPWRWNRRRNMCCE